MRHAVVNRFLFDNPHALKLGVLKLVRLSAKVFDTQTLRPLPFSRRLHVRYLANHLGQCIAHRFTG